MIDATARIPAGKKFDKFSVSALPIREAGHGLSPEVGAIHVQVARPPGGGIELDLIARRCERRATLLVSNQAKGTTAPARTRRGVTEKAGTPRLFRRPFKTMA